MEPVFVVLCSGGMDSAVALAKIMKEEKPDTENVVLLFFDYGQPTAQREERCVLRWAWTYNILHNVRIGLPDLFTVTGKARPGDPQEEGEEEVPDPDMFIPGRNLIFFSYAYALGTQYLEVPEQNLVLVHGAQVGDEEGYPDCRLNFFVQLQNLLGCYTDNAGGQIAIWAPLLKLSKPDIIRLGIELGVNFAATWSSYYDMNDATSTPGDASSIVRAQAFEEVGMEDPLLVKGMADIDIIEDPSKNGNIPVTFQTPATPLFDEEEKENKNDPS